MPTSELYFSAHLKSPSGVEIGELLPFTSLEAMCCDIYASIPETAADLLRNGVDPMVCEYQVCDPLGRVLVEIRFCDLLRGRVASPERSRDPDKDWIVVMADLQQRSSAAIDRLDRATAWMNRLTLRALSVGDRTC